MIVKPLRENFAFILPFSVVFQEAARFGIWKLYQYAQEAFILLYRINSHFCDHLLTYLIR